MSRFVAIYWVSGCLSVGCLGIGLLGVLGLSNNGCLS